MTSTSKDTIKELYDLGKLTKEKVQELINEDPFLYVFLPDVFKNDTSIKEHTIRRSPSLIREMGFETPLIELALDTNNSSLRFVPFALRSENLVKKAISANYKTVVHATYEQKQEEAFVKWCLNVSLDTAPILARSNPNSKHIQIALFWLKNK